MTETEVLSGLKLPKWDPQESVLFCGLDSCCFPQTGILLSSLSWTPWIHPLPDQFWFPLSSITSDTPNLTLAAHSLGMYCPVFNFSIALKVFIPCSPGSCMLGLLPAAAESRRVSHLHSPQALASWFHVLTTYPSPPTIVVLSLNGASPRKPSWSQSPLPSSHQQKTSCIDHLPPLKMFFFINNYSLEQF